MATALCLVACQGTTNLVVEIDSETPIQAAAFVVDVTNADARQRFTAARPAAIPPQQSLWIEFGGEREGRVDVRLAALDGGGEELAAAAGSIALEPNHTVRLRLVLGPPGGPDAAVVDDAGADGAGAADAAVDASEIVDMQQASDAAVSLVARVDAGLNRIAVDNYGVFATVPGVGVIKIPPAGPAVWLSGEGYNPMGLAIESGGSGMVYWTNFGSNHVYRNSKVGDAGVQAIHTLVTMQPQGIALTSDEVYWTSYFLGRVLKIAKSDIVGGIQVVYDYLSHPRELVAYGIGTGTMFYWTEEGTDASVPDGRVCGAHIGQGCDGGGAGCCQDVIAESQAAPFGLHVTISHVYWVDEGDGDVYRRVKTMVTPPELLDHGDAPHSIVVDGNVIYWTDHGGNKMVAKNIVTQTRIEYPASQPTGIALHGGYVYWLNDGDGTIVRIPQW